MSPILGQISTRSNINSIRQNSEHNNKYNKSINDESEFRLMMS